MCVQCVQQAAPYLVASVGAIQAMAWRNGRRRRAALAADAPAGLEETARPSS